MTTPKGVAILALAFASFHAAAAWEWSGVPVPIGDVAESPGVPVTVAPDGLRPVESGELVYVSNRMVVVDHGDDLWSVYGVELTDSAVLRLLEPPYHLEESELLAATAELLESTVWLSVWDQRTKRWVDPRSLLPIPESTIQKINLVGVQDGRVRALADLDPGRARFLVATGFPRLESPREIALLINGQTIGRVRLDEIAGAPVRDFLGERYLEVGDGSLRAGQNQVEVLVFDFAGERRVHESNLTIGRASQPGR